MTLTSIHRRRVAERYASVVSDEIAWTHEYECTLCGVPVLQIAFVNGRRCLEPIYPPDPLQPGETRCQHQAGHGRSRRHSRRDQRRAA